RIIHGDCVRVMRRMESAPVDFILTDPPYITRYRDRSGRTVINDDNGSWLEPAFAEMYRLLKPGSFALSFYGWSQADRFIAAWRGGRDSVLWPASCFARLRQERASRLARGDVEIPECPPDDVVDWVYTGNRLHPTQKPVQVLRPFIEAFCPAGGVVLDPFCG